jgi:hypothetical protein
LKEFDCRDFKERPDGTLGRIKGYAADRSIAHKDMLLMLLQADFDQIMNRIRLPIGVATLCGAWDCSCRALGRLNTYLDIAVIGLLFESIWTWVYLKDLLGPGLVICFIILALNRVISRYAMKREDLDGWLQIVPLSTLFPPVWLIFLLAVS